MPSNRADVSGAGQDGVVDEVDETRSLTEHSEVDRPDGAQPLRDSARVPRGRATPSTTPFWPASGSRAQPIARGAWTTHRHIGRGSGRGGGRGRRDPFPRGTS